MDGIKESYWKIILLGAASKTGRERYRQISATLLFALVTGLLFSLLFRYSLGETVIKLTEEPQSILDFLLINFSDTPLLILFCLEAFLAFWFLLHRLFRKYYSIIGRLAVILIFIFLVAMLLFINLSNSLLIAFALFLIFLRPLFHSGTVSIFIIVLFLIKFFHPGMQLQAREIADSIIVIFFVIITTVRFRKLRKRYQKKLEQSNMQLQIFYSIRSFLHHGLVVLDGNLCIHGLTNKQAKQLLGSSLEAGKNFVDVIEEMKQADPSFRKQVISYFNALKLGKLTEADRIHSSPMKELKFFYPGGYKYLRIVVNKVFSESLFFVLIIEDISTQLELYKRRQDWLNEEFNDAELLRSFLIEQPLLIEAAEHLRNHYINLDKLLFENRKVPDFSIKDSIHTLFEELKNLKVFFERYHFPSLKAKIQECQQQAETYLNNRYYEELVNLLTNIETVVVELRRLYKLMNDVIGIRKEENFSSLQKNQKKRLLTLMKHLWYELEREEQTNLTDQNSKPDH